MRTHISYTALGAGLGLALVAGAPPAAAQMVLTPGVYTLPAVVAQRPLVAVRVADVVTAPARHVQPRMVRPAPLAARPIRHRVVRHIVPRPAALAALPARPLYDQVTTTRAPRPIVAAPVVTYQQPLYDQVTTTQDAGPIVGVPIVTYQQPLYNRVVPAPVVVAPSYTRRLYDVVPAPALAAPIVRTTPVADGWYDDDAPVSAPVPVYRYVYEYDRILVIDPGTNAVVQVLPR